MARMHILTAGGENLYQVIVHAPTPAGNNSAGVAWSTALQNSGLAKSALVVGNGAGQITNSENNQVTAGTVIEANFNWQDDPNWTNQQRLDDLNARASIAVSAVLADYASRLKFFGYTVA